MCVSRFYRNKSGCVNQQGAAEAVTVEAEPSRPSANVQLTQEMVSPFYLRALLDLFKKLKDYGFVRF